MNTNWTNTDLDRWLDQHGFKCGSRTKSRARAADVLTISPQHLSNVLKGRHPVGPRIINAVKIYEMELLRQTV